MICPECGKRSWITTSEGPKCKNCGYVEKGDTPVRKVKKGE